MLIRHLYYFVTLAREKHFARAADLCHVAQPTLSAAIRKLEDELGVTLVVRGHRFGGLTPDGEKLLAWGRQILIDYDSLRDDLGGSAHGLAGTLRLGVIPAAIPAIAILTAAFSAANPAATIEIRSMTSRAIAGGLDSFELDGGLTYLDNEPVARVARVPLYRERYCLIVARDHHLAGRRDIGWQDIADERLCLLSEDMQNRRIIDALAASAGVVLHPMLVSNSFLGVIAHLRHGDWASIVPRSFLTLFGPDDALVALDLVDPLHSEAIGLIVSDRDPRSPMVHALLLAARSIDGATAFAALQ